MSIPSKTLLVDWIRYEEAMEQLQLGIQALQAGNLDIAENIFKSILSENSSEVHSLHFLGVILCQKGNFQDGVTLIEKSIFLDPTRFAPYLNLGRILFGANKWESVVTALNEAVLINENSFDAWSMLAQANHFAGNSDAALMAGKKAAQLKPGDSEVFFSLGIYASEKNRDEAIDYYRHSISINPNSFKSWVNIGNLFLGDRNFNESIIAFEQALKLEPLCVQALLGLSRAYVDISNWLGSLESAQKALSLDSSSHEAAFLVGFSLHKLDRMQEAVNAYRVALKISPVAAQTHLYLASAYEALGEDLLAIQYYENATNIDPSLFLAVIYCGTLLHKRGDLILAIKKFRRAVNIDPSSAWAYFELGIALYDQGDVEEAITCYREVIDLKPDFEDAYLNLGYIFLKKGNTDEALQIVSALKDKMVIDDGSCFIDSQGNKLVFDWHSRRVINLYWEIQFAIELRENNPPHCLQSVNHVDSLCYPPSFLVDESYCDNSKPLYQNGYLVEENLVSPDICFQLISQFNDVKSMSVELNQFILDNSILKSVLERILFHTGFPHLAWNCIYIVKGPDDNTVSDAWHYDNQYNKWTPKVMVYLNSQGNKGGATDFVDARISRQFSSRTDYMGLICQRESYPNRVSGLVNDLNLDPVTLDPKHYTFSPEHPGTCVWFCPSRVLHRGVCPQIGLRYVLTFSLTPLPADCEWSIDQCVEKSIEILEDKISNGMQNKDINPYWIPAMIS